MNREGPPLEALMRRIAETPAPFLAEPAIKDAGQVVVAAVAADLCRLLGGAPSAGELAALDKATRNHLAVTLLLCWLLADPWFREGGEHEAALALLVEGAQELAAATTARKFVLDSERREELARFALARLGCRPQGETEAQAQDRLTSLSAAERARVIKASREAEKRARSIREALARKAAEESADKWTRE